MGERSEERQRHAPSERRRRRCISKFARGFSLLFKVKQWGEEATHRPTATETRRDE